MKKGHVCNYHYSAMDVQATSFIQKLKLKKPPLLIMKPKTKKLATLSMLAMAMIADQHYALL